MVHLSRKMAIIENWEITKREKRHGEFEVGIHFWGFCLHHLHFLEGVLMKFCEAEKMLKSKKMHFRWEVLTF